MLINARKMGDNLFVPSHTEFTIPADAKEGDCHVLSLEDGRDVEYTLPKGVVAGEVHIVRVDQATKTIKVTVHKAEASKLGIVLSNLDDGRHVVCTEIQETGALHGKGLMHVGDVILSVSAVVPPSTKPTTLEATHHRSVGGLLQSAVGEIHFEVERPEPAIPTRILHSAFLSKRSPNVIFGKSVWQRRWFELASSHLSYWELSERSDDSAKSQSFLGTQRGMIALMDVAGVRVDRADPRHFDILMKNKRLYQFYAPKPGQAAEFAGHISKASPMLPASMTAPSSARLLELTPYPAVSWGAHPRCCT